MNGVFYAWLVFSFPIERMKGDGYEAFLALVEKKPATP